MHQWLRRDGRLCSAYRLFVNGKGYPELCVNKRDTRYNITEMLYLT